LELAVREHQEGRLDDAMALYQHVLSVDPTNADALHLSGMVELSRGRVAEAIGLMERALASVAKGGSAPAHFRSNLGNAYRELGEHERAESEYRGAIAAGGGTPEVFNNLGLTLVARGRPTWAIEAFESSLARRPGHAGTLTNLSVACLAAGAAAEALRCADEALSVDGSFAPARLTRATALAALDRRDDAIVDYGALLESSLAPVAVGGFSDVLFASGKSNEAIALSSRVVRDFPTDFTALRQHAANLARGQRITEAEAVLAQACQHHPRSAAAHAQRGAMLLTLGRPGDAIAALRRATELDPADAEAWSNLSAALLAMRDATGAVEAAEHAMRLAERSAFSLGVLGAALLGARRFSEAHAIFRDLVATAPSADAWNGLGVSFERTGRIVEARDAYARAVEVDPTHDAARFNHAAAMLLLGDWAEGWSRYDTSRAAFRGTRSIAAERAWRPGAVRPDGSPPTVLLVTEQGLGDAIQFVRFAAVVRVQAARVIVQAAEPLRRLLATVPGVDEVIGFGESREHDLAIYAMSLPRVLGVTLESVPDGVPYLKPAPDLFDAWRSRLGARRGLRIAVAWTGSPTHMHDASRSIALAALQPLAAVPGIEWFSVQRGSGVEQLDGISRSGWSISDLGPSLHDLADTAAALSHMDLVITVDTSVAHLAGALGVRTWTLLAHPPEWRWLLDRRDTPWYPTMTLFRQREVDQWGPVVARVRHRLERLVRSKLH
jgi:tetratricopeptide (TPR) repeat protein